MSKHVKHVNSGTEFCMEKLDFLLESKIPLLTLVFLVKLTSFHYNATCAGAGYKEVTLKNHGNNGLAILRGSIFLPRKYTE